jgi:hypothetical protein
MWGRFLGDLAREALQRGEDLRAQVWYRREARLDLGRERRPYQLLELPGQQAGAALSGRNSIFLSSAFVPVVGENAG